MTIEIRLIRPTNKFYNINYNVLLHFFELGFCLLKRLTKIKLKPKICKNYLRSEILDYERSVKFIDFTMMCNNFFFLCVCTQFWAEDMLNKLTRSIAVFWSKFDVDSYVNYVIFQISLFLKKLQVKK